MKEKVSRGEVERELKKRVSHLELQRELGEVGMRIGNKVEREEMSALLDAKYVQSGQLVQALSTKVSSEELRTMLGDKVSH